jgi:hypothetical protein
VLCDDHSKIQLSNVVLILNDTFIGGKASLLFVMQDVYCGDRSCIALDTVEGGETVSAVCTNNREPEAAPTHMPRQLFRNGTATLNSETRGRRQQKNMMRIENPTFPMLLSSPRPLCAR